MKEELKINNPKTRYALLRGGIFAVYAGVTLLGALHHEVWLDEAQAWVILRDTPFSGLPYRLHVEGHPPLWYLILYPFVKLGFPTDYVSVISWLFMVAGAWLLLFKVELPLPLKSVILASSGFLYVNSVMLRVYCLIPPLLFLILWAYPKRREHPALYGLLIALLANTHILVCGIVGMLGIFMLWDLFSEWKGSSKKENAWKLAGLAIAGAGVLILVLPLLGSFSSNQAVASSNTMPNMIGRLLWIMCGGMFDSVFLHSIGGADTRGSIFWSILLTFVELLFCGMIILLRHWKRAFAVLLGFLVFYCITCELLWNTLANRAVIFILAFAFVLCLLQYEEPVFKDYRISGQITGKIRSFVEWLVNVDKNAKKVYTGMLFILFALTIPSGVSMFCRDITGTFCGAKETVKYISENFGKDAVFVQLSSGMPEISIYGPDIRIFSVDACGFTTFTRWEYRFHTKENAETVLKNLSEYEELYFISYDSDYDKKNLLFTAEGMKIPCYYNTINIYKFDAGACWQYSAVMDIIKGN